MNQSVSTYNSTLIGGGRGGERIYGQQYLHIALLSKTVSVPISFETDCLILVANIDFISFKEP